MTTANPQEHEFRWIGHGSTPTGVDWAITQMGDRAYYWRAQPLVQKAPGPNRAQQRAQKRGAHRLLPPAREDVLE